ncbi:hypothetical protein F4823DRAFT_589368 [Ustulina deusta]|nr:hypothetical protein F4823DRAFT_589368 [Ustulina deusta]
MILFSTFFFFSSFVSVSLQSWDRVAVIWIVNTAIKKAKRTDAVVSSSRTSIGDVSLLCSIPPFSAVRYGLVIVIIMVIVLSLSKTSQGGDDRMTWMGG